ncbi:S-layer protein [Arthrospira sp. PCC 8006]|uniref:S-layer homology domain-containing protein n=1 Tax=Arthrospira sp. PCC 8006 TaxID=1982224 RepID=UPI00396D6417
MSESDRADLQPRKQSPPTMEEWLAIILAIATMGFVFFWVLGKVEPKTSFSLLSAKPETISDHRSLINVSDIVRQASSSTTTIASSPDSPESKSEPSNTVSSESTGFTLSWLNLEGLQIASPTTESTPATIPLLSAPTTEAETTTTGTDTDTDTDTEAAVTSPSETPTTTETPPETTDTEAAVTSPSETPTTTETPGVPSPPLTTAETPETTDTEAAVTPDSATTILANVPEEHWARDFVVYFAEHNQAIGSEDGTFIPDQPVSRGQFASQLQQSLKTDRTQPDIRFQDIPQDYWANQAIQEATKMGFLRGYPGEVFQPNQEMTHTEVVVALVSGLDLPTPNNPQEILTVYSDADQIPDWAIGQVAAATEAGLVASHRDRNTFNPNQSVSQAEAIVMIYQVLVRSGDAEPIESDYLITR